MSSDCEMGRCDQDSMHRPLISIIITVLNGGETLTQCLNSIACQSFINYEVVIIDGGSTDNSINIIETSPIVNKTTQIAPGVGLYAGLNMGIDIARGEWLYFMGSDDRIHDANTFSRVSELMLGQPDGPAIIAGRVEYVKRGIITNPRAGSRYWLAYRLHHQGLFYNQAAFNGLRYNVSMSISADYELNMKLVVKGVPILFTDNVIAVFGEDGLSSRNFRQAYIERQRVHDRLFKGLDRLWVKVCSKVQYDLWLIRKRFRLA